MPLNQLKRALWMMSELVDAGDYGISFEELNSKWVRSPMNDRKSELPERTFYRLRNELESLFDVNIDPADKRYVLKQNEYSVFLGMFCKLISHNSKYRPSLDDLMLHVMSGMEITSEEKKMITDIAFKLNRLAYETLSDIITEVSDGQVTGADHAQWANIKYHICIWREETFQRIATWVGVAIDHKGEGGKGVIKFYIVNETNDKQFHTRLMEDLNLLHPEQLDGKFWWFAPRVESLRTIIYSSQPNVAQIKSVIEQLCQELNSIQ